DFARALDRVHHAGELGEHAVASGTDESAVVEFDQSVDDFAVRGESAESRLFVVPHEAAVTVHICAENGGELTFQPEIPFLTPASAIPISRVRAVAQSIGPCRRRPPDERATRRAPRSFEPHTPRSASTSSSVWALCPPPPVHADRLGRLVCATMLAFPHGAAATPYASTGNSW